MTTRWLCVLSAVSSLTAQAPGPRHVVRPVRARELRLDPASYHQDRLVVKFREGFRVRLAPGAPGPSRRTVLTSPDGPRLNRVRAVLGGKRIERVFTRPVAELDRERAAIQERYRDQPAYAPPADLNNFYRVFTRGRAETLRTILALLDDASVETAYPEFHPGAIVPAQDIKRYPGDPSRGRQGYIGPLTPFFEPQQSYLDAAPAGLGFHPASAVLGAQGHPTQIICHIEGAWYFDHEDIPQLRTDRILGSRRFYWFDIPTWRDHGLGVVGILSAARDTKGVRGMVPRSKLYVCSLINGHGNAVSLATANAGPGDVFTSSAVQAVFYRGKGYHAPLDLVQDAYDAIRNAILKGVVITLAAGNTNADLGTKEIFGTRYLPESTPSGAIIVGATFGSEMTRVGWSNFGKAVVANGWGAKVWTCGYGHAFWSPEAPDQRSYTHVFGGTSAAAPQVAGVVAAIQSAAMRHFGKPLRPSAVLAAIERYGTPIQGGIGVRPDLLATMRGLGIIGGLRAMNEAAPGQKLTLGIELRPNELFILLGAVSGKTNAWPGLSYPFLVDPATMVVITAGTMPIQTPFPYDIPLPRIDFMQGLDLYYQGVRVDLKTSNIDLTNSVLAWLRSYRRDL